VAEIRDRRDKKLFNMLMEKYNEYGLARGLGKMRYLVYVVEERVEYWVAGATLQDAKPFARVLERLGVEVEGTLFLRRVASFVPERSCGVMAQFLRDLGEAMRREGAERLAGFESREYMVDVERRVGFVEVGRSRSGARLFVKYL